MGVIHNLTVCIVVSCRKQISLVNVKFSPPSSFLIAKEPLNKYLGFFEISEIIKDISVIILDFKFIFVFKVFYMSLLLF